MEPMVQLDHHILIVEQAEAELVEQVLLRYLQLMILVVMEELVLLFLKLVLQGLRVALGLYLEQNIFLEEVEEEIHLVDHLVEIKD